MLNSLTLSILFLRSPRLRRTQRVVGDVRSITLEIETVDHDNPPCPILVNLSPVDLSGGPTDVFPLMVCFYVSFIIDSVTVSLLSSDARPTLKLQDRANAADATTV